MPTAARPLFPLMNGQLPAMAGTLQVTSRRLMPEAGPQRAEIDREMHRPPADPSLLQLRCFLAIVEAGSFAEAGRRLGLSASVVSKTMARLEAAHGVKLLHRSTHAVSPTDEGLALIEPARTAERALAEV
ncbi:LysR family transcriptional regulator [uncultured Aureimonas sp.]|uniref:LysR family transcriptional regulator n=1 Tax=uncultured Aureimonas sp. TaxID=1604662 RepID=UPI0025FD3E65|nr:LysR family transcriptional regulator [uncultured Aureimonas sp.]